MTKRRQLIVGKEEMILGNDFKAANLLIKKHKLDTLPIIDSRGHCVALVTRSDQKKNQDYPLATKDKNKQLQVLVAVESRIDKARDRIEAALEAGASGIVVDSRNIFRDHLEIAKFAKELNRDWSVVVGNVVSGEVVKQVMDEAGAYIDAFRVGIGTGEMCITTEDLGIGRAMGSSLRDVVAALDPYKQKYGHIGVIADGGIKLPRHVLSALVIGADLVMMGTELGGLEQSPAKEEYDSESGRMVKTIRGMGSEAVIKERAGASRYNLLGMAPEERYAEGISKKISYKGDGEKWLKHFFSGLKNSMAGLDFSNIEELQKRAMVVPRVISVSKGTS